MAFAGAGADVGNRFFLLKCGEPVFFCSCMRVCAFVLSVLVLVLSTAVVCLDRPFSVHCGEFIEKKQ